MFMRQVALRPETSQLYMSHPQAISTQCTCGRSAKSACDIYGSSSKGVSFPSFCPLYVAVVVPIIGVIDR